MEAQQKEAQLRLKEDYKVYLQNQAREKKTRDLSEHGGKTESASILPYSNYQFKKQPVARNEAQAKYLKLEQQSEIWNAYKQQLDEKKERERMEHEIEKRKANELDKAAQKFLALERTKDLEKKQYIKNLYSENKNSHDYRRNFENQMRQQNQLEYSKNAEEAQNQDKKRKEKYDNFYSKLSQNQQKKEEVFHNYMQLDQLKRLEAQTQWRKQHEQNAMKGQKTPTPMGNKSMIAPWDGSVWNSERWKKEQEITNQILKKQVKEKDSLKQRELNSGSIEARHLNSRNNVFLSFEDQVKSKKAQRQKEYSDYLSKQIQLKRNHSSSVMAQDQRRYMLSNNSEVPKIPGLSLNPSFPQPRGKIEQRLYMSPTNSSLNKGAHSVSPLNRVYQTIEATNPNEQELQKQIKIYESNREFVKPRLSQIETVLNGEGGGAVSMERSSIHKQTAHQVLGYNTIINPIPGYQQNPYFSVSQSTTPMIKKEKAL